MWWLVILGLFLLVVVYILFVPMVLFIDTTKNTYYLKLKGMAKANVLTDDVEIIKIKLKLLFFNFYFYPFKPKKTSTKVEKTEQKPAKKNSKQIAFKKTIKLIKTFKVKQFKMDIDTGDCITNAKLYPLFALLNYKYGGFYVNFQDRNSFLLSLENRPIRIIKTFINS